MKVLFIFCEGPHDAHFVGRLLKDSKDYMEYKEILKDYPSPLRQFISNKFINKNINNIKIGKQEKILVPECGFKANRKDILVFPISFGGIDNTETVKEFLSEIINSFSDDILQRPENTIKEIAHLFIYDADSRGLQETVRVWNDRFREFLPKQIEVNQWVTHKSYRISLFVFTDSSGDKGTLEDNIIKLISNKNPDLIKDAKILIDNKFEAISTAEDQLAYDTKKKKGILTICGQSEKKIAGYALTVVVRDTKLLDGVFELEDRNNSQWGRLLLLIDNA